MTSSTKQLKQQVIDADRRLNEFIGILSSDYPELGICSTGSMHYNSAEIGITRHVAKQILNKDEYKIWQKLGIDSNDA